MFKAREKAHKEIQILSTSNQEVSTFQHRLNFYDHPPTYDVTLEEFEISALNRLRILAEIESSAARNRTWEELKEFVQQMCRRYLPLSYNSAKEDEKHDRSAERKKDHLGHFVLRLAFCRSEDLRRRFVKAETTLFKIRYNTEVIDARREFLNSRNFNWEQVDKEEKEKYSSELRSLHLPNATSKEEIQHFEKNACFYKVRWTRVPDLVMKRSVLLKSGWAYVPESEQASIILKEFETHLEKAMEVTARALPRFDEDTRLLPILDHLSKGFVAGVSTEWDTAYGSSDDNIKAEMIDNLARQHFPMCMRTLHENLRRDSHLRHQGRLHYGLFLKVLGLSIDEAIIFWKKAFNKMTDDKFNKEYKYNIRHSYGLEGKRANYPAKSCVRLLTCGPSEPGCPYRQFSPENLSTALLQLYSSQGLTSADVSEVMAIVKAGSYHVACTRVFELTHRRCDVKAGEGIGNGESVTHPNQYAARSIELEGAGAAGRMVIG